MSNSTTPEKIHKNSNKRNKMSNSTTPQEDSITKLPQQIIADILSRLPIKILLKFKCVSKPWCSLISSPEFAKIHLRRALQDTNLHHHQRLFLASNPFQSVDPERCCDEDTSETHLCCPSRIEGIDAELNILTTHIDSQMGMPEADFYVKGSCNGLICAIVGSNFFFVLNPTTRQSRELPMLPIEEDMIFDGFGYDPEHDDYKLVVGTYGGEVSIFSLKSNAWRTIEDPKAGVELKSSGIFLDGVLHWLVRWGSIHQTHVLIPFDLVQEKFLDQMPLPDNIHDFNLSRELKVIKNCLCVFTEYYATNYEAWVMKEYGDKDSWTKLLSFNSNPLPGSKYYLEPLWVTKNGNILYNRDGWYLVVCDPKEGNVKQIWISSNWDWCTAIMYVESLVSPDQ